MTVRRKPNPILGVILGVAGAMVLSFIVLVIYGVRGPDTFDRLGISLGSAIGLYFVAGIIGGALLGLLLPLTVWRMGAAFVGIMVAIPLYFGAGILLGDFDFYTGIILSVIVGGIVGYGLWLPPKEEKSAQ